MTWFRMEDDRRSSPVTLLEELIVKEYLDKKKEKEEKEKKDKDKNKGPKMITVIQCVLLLCATAPFVGMAMSAFLLAVYVKWAEVMKALVNQL